MPLCGIRCSSVRKGEALALFGSPAVHSAAYPADSFIPRGNPYALAGPQQSAFLRLLHSKPLPLPVGYRQFVPGDVHRSVPVLLFGVFPGQLRRPFFRGCWPHIGVSLQQGVPRIEKIAEIGGRLPGIEPHKGPDYRR